MTAPILEMERVAVSLGAFALRDISLALAPAEILVLMGANGAGKSVLLETIAGFHAPTVGRISIAGRDATRLPPEQRRVGFMVQNYGLFPHLSVAGNVGFAIRARRGAADVDIGKMLERFGVAPLANRLPHDLSPGEKQRVALARALASRPNLFLFDEPFAALDARTRETLRDDLRQFLREAKLAAILVSHDQSDVHVLADRVAVLHDGALQQIGSVDDVFSRPANRYVADSTGVENILSGAAAHRLLPGMPNAILCLRAEDVGVLAREARPESADNAIWLEAVVQDVVRLGPITRVTLDCGFRLVAALPRPEALGLAARTLTTVRIARASLHVLSGAGAPHG
ncbi:MAG: ABC transporter ATP-binding protein [Roseiarcus sp.]|jgi:molybdate/tungstate transport system ATP-binding protein